MNGLDLVDLDRYPINRPGTVEYERLIDACAAAFRHEAVALLPGFLTPAAVERMVDEVAPLEPNAFFSRSSHNVYLDSDHADEPANADAADPRARRDATSVGSIANDFLQPTGPVQQLYDLAELTRFVGEVVGVGQVFVSEDPLGAVSVNVFGPGDGHGWHFDEAPFTVTLMLRPASAGGHFEYVQGLRSDAGDGNASSICRVLDGRGEAPTRMQFEPGTLSIFAGRHTLHRVTAVEGEHARLVPVLTYAERPGYRNSDAVRMMFWGR